jgi:hypothetical protein
MQAGISKERSYDLALWMMAALLVVGFVANLLVKKMVSTQPLPPSAKPSLANHAKIVSNATGEQNYKANLLMVLGWCAVMVPLTWGVSMTLVKAARLLNLW